MREIKFKVWNNRLKSFSKSDYYIGKPFLEMDIIGSFSERLISVTDKDNIFLQYTLLEDENREDIYEGCILECSYFEYGEENKIIGLVKYEFDGFYVVGINEYEGVKKRLGDLERKIIGNIYENEELLKEKK